MKTVQDYKQLGLVFIQGDYINTHEGKKENPLNRSGVKYCNNSVNNDEKFAIEFAWRNNDGVKPEYKGAMKVELDSGDVIFNCGKTSEFDWRINDDVSPKIIRWRPIVISDGIAGCGYSFAINECQKPSFLQQKPKVNLIVPDSLKAEVRRVGSEINVTISQKYKQENTANNLESVISIDTVCDVIKSVSPKEDKPMKPVYTAEMHAKNELPPVGSDFNIEGWNGRNCTMTAIGRDNILFIYNKIEYVREIKNTEMKPITKTIKVNGFDVPAPMSEAPEDGAIFYSPVVYIKELCNKSSWSGDDLETLWLSRGLIHSTKLAAIAHAKAMLGIDPNA